MAHVETEKFTVGVFQNAAWAERGIEALMRHGFDLGSLSLLARETSEVTALMQKTFSSAGTSLDVQGLGRVVAHGPLLDALQGAEGDFARLGIAATMRRVGFQAHDGFIFDTLTNRGGVLVAIRSDPRAADALAVLLAYGGGNAAIGAWTGRV